IDCLDAREQLHATPKLLNAYQLSKWMAEFHLIQHQRDLGLPLTLFRPSIIIGHQETGWSSGAPFGMFSLIELVLGARRLRAEHLQIEVRAEAQPDLVCVDTVVERAQGLLSAREHREPVEIFHCVADTRLPMVEALRPASTQLGVSLGFGPLKSAVDVELDRLFEGNKPFANRTWTFRSERLQRVLGSAYVPRPISPDIVRRSTNYYLTQSLRLVALEQQAGPLSALSARLSPGPGLTGNAPGSLAVSPP
ncbi:MAG: SDR family oxidoreductase, partial [Cystobacter sp.]